MVQTLRRIYTANSSPSSGSEEDSISDDIEQLFELTRIIVMVLTGLLPTLAEPNSKGLSSSFGLSTALKLTVMACSTLGDI